MTEILLRMCQHYQLYTTLNTCQLVPVLSLSRQVGQKRESLGMRLEHNDLSEIKQSCVGRSKSYLTYFHLEDLPVITVIFPGNLERVTTKTFTSDIVYYQKKYQVIYIRLVPSPQGYSPRFLVSGGMRPEP